MHSTWKRSFAVRTAFITTLILLVFGARMQGARGWEVEEYLLCKDLSGDLPVDVTDTFSVGDEEALLWANVTDVTVGLEFRWEWYFPNGSLFIPFEIEATQPYVWVGAWGSLSIRDHAPALIPGTWTVKFYVGGVLQATVPFEIVAAGPTATVTGTEPSTGTPTMTVTVTETETSRFAVTETSVTTSTETKTTSVTAEIIRTDVVTLGAAAGVALIAGLLGGALIARKRT